MTKIMCERCREEKNKTEFIAVFSSYKRMYCNVCKSCQKDIMSKLDKKELWKMIYNLDNWDNIRWIRERIDEELKKAGLEEKKYSLHEIIEHLEDLQE